MHDMLPAGPVPQPPAAARASGRQVETVRRICETIHAALDGEEGRPPTLTEIAGKVGGSPHHLQKTFKRLMGVSPAKYADWRRLGRLKARLKDGADVTGALYEAGYGASSRLYERSDAQLGMTPATYARGGAGAEIAWTTAETSMGWLLVAATRKGVAFVALGDRAATLESEVAREFPKAKLRRDDEVLADWVAAVALLLEGRTPHVALPLDVRATAFQRRVWDELTRIPAGATRSYTEIARDGLGNPNARRAVARACATNPVALLIPCHRVLRDDGSLGGYRWGMQRKAAILQHEAAERGRA